MITVINADIRRTIISMTGNSNAAHVAVALSEVEILNAVYSRHQGWPQEVPLDEPGNSSPIVARGKVFVTQSLEDGSRRCLISFDRKTGEKLWQRETSYAEKEPTHKTNPFCSASPSTNGEVVVVNHGSAGMFAYDFSGKELWRRIDLDSQRHIWGTAASPVPYANTFIQHRGPGPRVYLIALTADTGKTLWKRDLPKSQSKDEKHWFGSWSTPVLRNNNGRDELLLGLPKRLDRIYV